MLRCPLCSRDLALGTTRCAADTLIVDDPFDPMIGAILAGRYRILGRRARGGMASVYVARHVLIERLSAIKILRADLGDDAVQRDRFRREARAVNRINHENIVEITDYGESEDGRVYLVMEYLPGESLQHRMQAGPMELDFALDVCLQIASGLGRAHQMGVIHRDLKPDNILLVPREGGGEVVKVLDFGIAKLLDQPALTATDRVFGTPGYIAPEYASGGTLDGRADLYSLGVVFYEMITGALPLEAASAADLLLKHMTEEPIPPQQRRPDLPAPVVDFSLRMLAKNPDERFRDAYHLIDDGRRVRERIAAPSPARRPTAPWVANAAITPIAPTANESREIPVAVPLPPPVEKAVTRSGLRAWQRCVAARRARPGDDAANNVDVSAAESVVARMSERADEIDRERAKVLALEERGRDFRATIGRATDALAIDRSARARERDAIAQAYEQQQRERVRALADGREGDADAHLWQLAATEQDLRRAVVAVEDLEFQLGELHAQLERLSENLEEDLAARMAQLDTRVGQQGRDDRVLRGLFGVE